MEIVVFFNKANMAAYVNAIERVKEKYGLNVTLKPQQTDISGTCKKGGVPSRAFSLLPTGFGKSMTYIFVPLILDEVSSSPTPSIMIANHVDVNYNAANKFIIEEAVTREMPTWHAFVCLPIRSISSFYEG